MLEREFFCGAVENYDDISPEAYKRVFKPFYDAQPQNPQELQIYRNMVDDLEPYQLEMVTPDLITDFAKYEALRREYAVENNEIGNRENIELRYERKIIYTKLADALMTLIEFEIGELR